MIRKRLRIVLEDGAEALASGRSSDLHALRIAVKRLRYNLEFAVHLEHSEASSALDLLALLQERLGALSDADTFRRTYGAMLDGIEADDPRRPGLENLRDSARTDRERALEAVRDLWHKGGEKPYPEKLAASISAALGSLSPKPES